MPHALTSPEQWLRYMPAAQHQRQELRLVESAWDQLALLSSLSLLSTKASSGGDLAQARQDFAALSTELMRGLADEALKNRVDDLVARAQVCIDVLVRNLFERTADIGFFATDVGVAEYLGAPDEAQRPTVENRLREYAHKYTVYGNIYLFDTEGRLRASLRPVTPLEGAWQAADQDFLQSVPRATGPYVEHYAVHGFSGRQEPTLVYARHVMAQGRCVGVLCLEFKLADEMPAIFESIQGGNQGADAVLALVDPTGRVIASSDALQLPPGWQLPQAADAGVQTLQHLSRRYLMVVRETQGFQGYVGPGWRAAALLPLDLAFDESTQEDRAALMGELDGQADLLSDELRDIPRRSSAIQSALERSVWNGLLELNAIREDGDTASRELQFAKTLLAEIGVTARKTAQAFAGALQDLYSVVTRSLLRDAQSRAALAMQILDRNLYERANDCRWWALTPQFASTLRAGQVGCEQAAAVLREINGLYTVYSCLVLFDRQGQVLAVSRPEQAHHVGTRLDEAWVGTCLQLRSSQDYTVSPYAVSRFYEQGPTFVYAAAVRDLAAPDGPALGGIAIVWDAVNQLQSILADCAVGTGERDVLAFVDARDEVLLATGDATALHGAEAVEACRTGGRMVNLQGHLYGVGMARGQGYREFRAQDGYDHGLSCLALRHLCERRRTGSDIPVPAAHHAGPRLEDIHRVQMATFLLGTHWLGLEAAQVIAAAPDVPVLSAGAVPAPFLGLAQIGARVCSVVDLRSVVTGLEDAGGVSRAADPNRQIVVVKVSLADGRPREFALRVDALGPMLDLDRRQFHGVGNAGATGAALIDAVVSVPTTESAQGHSMLCRISAQWLQSCASGAPGDASPQDLSALTADS
jgi:chemotaxis signal transduction protein